MSYYEKIIQGLSVAIIVAYGSFVFMMVGDDGLIAANAGYLLTCLVIYVVVIIIITVICIVYLSSKSKQQNVEPDEREELVDIKSERVGYFILEFSVIGLVLLSLVEAFNGNEAFGSFSLTSSAGLIFALISVVSISGFSRLVAAIIGTHRA